jgi:hypothetical protein
MELEGTGCGPVRSESNQLFPFMSGDSEEDYKVGTGDSTAGRDSNRVLTPTPSNKFMALPLNCPTTLALQSCLANLSS